MLNIKNTVMAKEKVKPNDKIKVYGTGKLPSMPAGKEYEVHRIHGENLISKGAASKDKPEKSKK